MQLSGDVQDYQKKDKVNLNEFLMSNQSNKQYSLFIFLGAYTTHQMVCRLALTSYDQVPEQLAPFAFVEFTMPATQASHTTVRSVSVQESDSDEPPEKYVRYLARHEYK